MAKVRPRALNYMRNKHFGFEELGDESYRISTTVEDTFFAAELALVVQLPEWEIRSIDGRIKRCFNQECRQAEPILQKAVGVRIGAGLTKKIDGLIGGSDGCTNMANILLESCHLAIDGIHHHVDLQSTAQGLSRAGHRQLAAGSHLRQPAGHRPGRLSGVRGHGDQGSIRVPSTSRNRASHRGWAGQAGAVTRLPSTWAASTAMDSKRPPQRVTSGPTAG